MEPTLTRVCTKCRQTLPNREFDKYESHNYKKFCRECGVTSVKNRYLLNKKSTRSKNFSKEFINWNDSALYC